MFKAESELEATPPPHTHMEPLSTAEKHCRAKGTEAVDLSVSFLVQMSHAAPGQQQGDFRQTEGKCERQNGKKMATLAESAAW